MFHGEIGRDTTAPTSKGCQYAQGASAEGVKRIDKLFPEKLDKVLILLSFLSIN